MPRLGCAAESRVTFQEKIASVEGFGFERRAIGGDEAPMANFAAKQINGAERWEVSNDFGIVKIGGFGED